MDYKWILIAEELSLIWFSDELLFLEETSENLTGAKVSVGLS